MTTQTLALWASLSLAGSASAQLPSGLLGGMLPNVASTSAGNAAGLLSFCVKNKLLGGQDASSVIGSLTGQPGVTTSKDFAQGQAGVVQTGNGSGLSLANLKGQMKTKLCDMVLQHGKSLAGL
ncbi:DUF2501 domain-containing protein [Sphingomonas sp. AP4-R1]|uniref:DUF2501 domain-containing protein n=1 Tax=Sphingomonas sp. AP4-R1 TaxID=2735134 RepID=UPI0020A3160B|nr:DUF2501 domain-containing protein [Sphingomonas sp. AP4-R1]